MAIPNHCSRCDRPVERSGYCSNSKCLYSYEGVKKDAEKERTHPTPPWS